MTHTHRDGEVNGVWVSLGCTDTPRGSGWGPRRMEMCSFMDHYPGQGLPGDKARVCLNILFLLCMFHDRPWFIFDWINYTTLFLQHHLRILLKIFFFFFCVPTEKGRQHNYRWTTALTQTHTCTQTLKQNTHILQTYDELTLKYGWEIERPFYFFILF